METLDAMLNPEDTKKLNIFCRRVGRGINRFRMIEDGDRILIGVSGGKDSLSLAWALKKRMEWVPIKYQLFALLIEWKEYTFSSEAMNRVENFFDSLEIPLKKVKTTIYPPSFREFNCYLCARNRKRILFEEARDREIDKIALGHTMDDIVETTLLNLFFRGEFATMMPVQSFFRGKLKILRPMCEVEEKKVIQFARRFNLPVISNDCPNKDTNQRNIMKDIVRQLSRHNRQVRKNIYRSPWFINRDFLPTRLS